MKRTDKKKTIQDFATHKKDTGSPQVQIALLTVNLKHLTKHIETHPKDEAAKRGLLGMVANRRKLLNYLREHNKDAYDKIVTKIGLRK